MSNKNKSKYNLSATEMEIMEYIWSIGNKLIGGNIKPILTKTNQKLKKQTLNTFSKN